MEGLNFRCPYEATQAEGADFLQPIDRFVDGLLALKPGKPGRVVYAAFVGVPQAAEQLVVDGDALNQDFERILALDAMQVRPGTMACEPEDSRPACTEPSLNQVAPACEGASGRAIPGRRFVELARAMAARGLGGNAQVSSICPLDYTQAMSRLAERIVRALRDGC